MFYFVLAAVVFVALVLIFRDDHDRRYDQRNGSERQYLAEKQAPASAPRPEPRTNARKTMEAEIEFEAFNPKNLPCPFNGRITVDTSNHLYGTLHITQPGF